MTLHSPSASTSDAKSAPPALVLPRVVKAVRTSAPPVPYDIQRKVLEATARVVELARTLYQRNFPMPTVAFDLRGRTAGQAFLQKNMLRYNAVLLMENLEDFLAEIVPHEVAHLVAHQYYGARISAHGPEWKSVMRKLGVEPNRTHSLDTTNSAVGAVQSFTCRCGKIFALSARRSKAALRGQLICRKCSQPLKKVVPGMGAPTLPTPVARPTLPPAPVPPRTPPIARPPFRQPLTPVTPRIPSPTPAPLPAPTVRPPTPAMLQYAMSLARRLGLTLLPDQANTFAACSTFIERHKLVSAKAPTTPVGPSERQLQYARDIATRKKLTVPPDALVDGSALSRWISANR